MSFIELDVLISLHLSYPIAGEEHLKIISELCSLAEAGKFRPPANTVSKLQDGQFEVALDNSMKSMIGAKQLLDMQT